MRKKIAALLLAISMMVSGTVLNVTPFEELTISANAKSTPSATTVGKAVKKAYGDNYVPSVKLTKSEVKDAFGVSSKYYTSVYAEIAPISTQVDTLVIFKCKDTTSRKKVLSLVKSYRKSLIKDSIQYPMNQVKVEASRIYYTGKYVCFIMLGRVSNKVEESGDDEKILKAYKSQNEIAVKAIKKAIK